MKDYHNETDSEFSLWCARHQHFKYTQPMTAPRTWLQLGLRTLSVCVSAEVQVPGWGNAPLGAQSSPSGSREKCRDASYEWQEPCRHGGHTWLHTTHTYLSCQGMTHTRMLLYCIHMNTVTTASNTNTHFKSGHSSGNSHNYIFNSVMYIQCDIRDTWIILMLMWFTSFQFASPHHVTQERLIHYNTLTIKTLHLGGWAICLKNWQQILWWEYNAVTWKSTLHACEGASWVIWYWNLATWRSSWEMITQTISRSGQRSIEWI